MPIAHHQSGERALSHPSPLNLLRHVALKLRVNVHLEYKLIVFPVSPQIPDVVDQSRSAVSVSVDEAGHS